MEKVNRKNLTEHLVRHQLKMVGKTWEDALADEQWYYNITMTKEQFDEFMAYALPLVKKILKCNKSRAEKTLSWFNLQFGLRIYPCPFELNSKPINNVDKTDS